MIPPRNHLQTRSQGHVDDFWDAIEVRGRGNAPAGRATSLSYASQRKLNSITDAEGLDAPRPKRSPATNVPQAASWCSARRLSCFMRPPISKG